MFNTVRMNKKILKPFKQMKNILIFQFFVVTLISCQGQTINNNVVNSDTLDAITTAVFVDNADKFEYTVGMNIGSGTLAQNQYIQAKGGDGSAYFFQVKEIKVNDQVVDKASTNDQAFVILNSNKKAASFNEGFKLTNATKSDFMNNDSKDSENNPTTITNTNEPKWTFNINGQSVITAPSLKDNDEPIALFNSQNNQLTVSLYGDILGSKRRGMLTMVIDHWAKQKGQKTLSKVGYVRYKDQAGNELAQWKSTSQDSNEINIVSIAEGESNVLGEVYYISGNWSSIILTPSPGYENLAGGNMTISGGKFDHILVQEMYKKKTFVK